MNRNQGDVTDAELALMQALWDQGRGTIRQLVERVYGQDGTAVYATVQKLLERLEAKGFVARDRSQPVHVFAATVGRDELIGRRLKAVADALCGGSLTPLLTQLVQGGELSARDRKELRSLIDRLDRKRRGPARAILDWRQSERMNHGTHGNALDSGVHQCRGRDGPGACRRVPEPGPGADRPGCTVSGCSFW